MYALQPVLLLPKTQRTDKCFFHQRSTLHLCTKKKKISNWCNTVTGVGLLIYPFCPLIACFKLCRTRPPGGFQPTFNRATLGGDLPRRDRLECRINQCEIKEGFGSEKMTLLSPFPWLHPRGISLRSMAWLSTDTDIEWQRCFLLPVISQDR